MIDKRSFAPAIIACVMMACTATNKATTTTDTKATETAPAPLVLNQSLPDQEEKKTLYGILTKNQISQDTAFGWYASNLKYFKADSLTVQRIREKKDQVHLVLFCGTWCHDSQQLVPKYFKTLEAAGFSDDRMTIIGVDRSKKTIATLSEAFDVVNIPTMIVLENGKEVGRIVEYGKTALVDKELGEIIATVK